MFDLAKMDVFRDSDIILTVKPGHDAERLKLYLDAFEKLGMEVHAYSDRTDHVQYMLVPDRPALIEQLHQSCRNSLGGIHLGELQQVKGALPGELVV